MLPGFSLFICIFLDWLMGACGLCLSCSGLMETRFFSLSLMLFCGRIGDLCNASFDGDFALL